MSAERRYADDQVREIFEIAARDGAGRGCDARSGRGHDAPGDPADRPGGRPAPCRGLRMRRPRWMPVLWQLSEAPRWGSRWEWSPALVFGSAMLTGATVEGLFGPAAMAASGVGAMIANAVRLPGWARRREAQMEHVAARVAAMLQGTQRSMNARSGFAAAALLAGSCILPGSVAAQADPLVAPYERCSSCADWNVPKQAIRLFGNTFYVGTHGLASLLITSPEGHVLIDGGLPESAPLILENIRSLGFDPRDVGLILISHAHFDHVGGVAALHRATGARVAATPWAARVLERGGSTPDDPQFGLTFDFPGVPVSETFGDGQVVRIGALSLTAHVTAGHTPGGTSWSWISCEGERCLHFVYADSQTPVAAEGFRYTDSTAYPNAVADMRRSHELLERLPCDVLITPHPGASRLWERVARGVDGVAEPGACQALASTSRQQLERRLEMERPLR